MSVDLGDGWTEAKLLTAARAIKEASATPAWPVVLQLLDDFVVMVGKRGLRDKEHDREWWIGFQECAEVLRNALGPDGIMAGAAMLQQQLETEEQALSSLGAGPGSLAGA